MNPRKPEQHGAFGLVAWLEQTKVSLPLKGVECRFDVTAGVARVEIDQIYHHDGAKAFDCLYTFPLPSGAAVFRCEMHVNERVIRAIVEERGEAKRIYEEQKAAGHRAALVETERDNLFTLSLGNVQPGDTVAIRFAYFQTLERTAEELGLRVPVCPGVRYIPGKPLLRSLSGRGSSDDTAQVPDASRISPPRIEARDPDAAYFAVTGTIARSDVAGESLSSPSHTLVVRPDEAKFEVELAERGAVPDSDFVLRWIEPRETALTPRAWSYRTGSETFALVQLRAPKEVQTATAFPQDFYFLIDRSGSMEGAKWTKTCEALTAFVRLLGPDDRVWITLFESNFQDYAERPMPAAGVLKDPAFKRLVDAGVAGGTELMPAAKHVLETIARHSTDRRSVVVLITDGQVGNEREIMEAFRRQPALTVFTFGIDTVVNDAFLKDLARKNGGECWLQTPNDDIAGTVARLGARLRRPMLTGLHLRGKWEAAGRLPDLYEGQTVALSLRLVAGEAATVEFDGTTGAGETYPFQVALAPVDNDALGLLWARDHISTQLDAGNKSEAIAIAKRWNIVCEGAAFVAWDNAERVTVAQQEIYQPSLEPAFAPAVCAAAPAMMACFEMAPPSSGPSRARAGAPSFLSKLRTGNSATQSFSAGPTSPDEYYDKLTALGVDSDFAYALSKWGDGSWIAGPIRRRMLNRLVAKLESAKLSGRQTVQECRTFAKKYRLPENARRALDAWEARLPVTAS